MPGRSAYEVAVARGYPYIAGEGRPKAVGDYEVWMSRFTTLPHGGEALYVGYDNRMQRWIVEEEG
jgi:hypothetical protein